MKGGGGELLVHLLGSRNSISLLPVIAPKRFCPPPPPSSQTLFNLANTPSNYPRPHPPTPNFLATLVITPSSQLLTPFSHPLASHPNCCPLSKHLPSCIFFLHPPSTLLYCHKCPQDSGSLSYSPLLLLLLLLQTLTSPIQSALSPSLSPSPSTRSPLPGM